MKKGDSWAYGCPRCGKFVGFNPLIHGRFCSVGCRMDYNEGGSFSMSEEKREAYYEKTLKESMDAWEKRRKEKRKKRKERNDV